VKQETNLYFYIHYIGGVHGMCGHVRSCLVEKILCESHVHSKCKRSSFDSILATTDMKDPKYHKETKYVRKPNTTSR